MTVYGHRYQLTGITPGHKVNKQGGALATQGTFTSMEGGLTYNQVVTQVITSKRSLRRDYGSRIDQYSFPLANGETKRVFVRAPSANNPLGQQRAGQYVGMKMSSFLAGAANTILQSGAAYPIKGRPLHYKGWTITKLMVHTGWNRSTGNFLGVVLLQTDDFGTGGTIRDDAAFNPSTSNSFGLSRVPGKFAFLTSSKIPSKLEYSKSTLD